ncbi:PRD domain-containing protein [Paenibacillus tritici]|uniref:PRD domain-containing protein n=1 Tax=Paenibacillus tritici TaxID=1873425 RepID=A0ABX2DR45_9BACL|nr:PRD domain-containing protein [Paenibacillus tritici]NQX46549.1 PRD domain-containing protein [Paenibacillus tritici]QUL54921.1 PRD domain-containing protein [Paenibacillus tritici]
MRIAKVLNNNAIITVNDQNKEVVVIGRGIAFKKKPGDLIEEDKIEKVFMDNESISDKMKTLLSEIPLAHMEISERIINLAKMNLGKRLHDSIYVSLTDHIHSAIERFRQGHHIKNVLLWEVKKFYKDEFEIGEKALLLIHEELGIRFPEDEAAHIALHLVNAHMNEEIPNVVKITKIMHEILNIVKYHFKIDYDEESLTYYRFVTHLKFFARRILNGTHIENTDSELYEMVKQQYKDSFLCGRKIQDYIRKTYNCTLTNEEVMYLTIHIERVVHLK